MPSLALELSPRVLPWRGPLGTNPSGRGSFSNSGREPRRKQRKVRLAELEGCGKRKEGGKEVHTDLEATTRPGGYGVRGMEGSNMHEGGLSFPIVK